VERRKQGGAGGVEPLSSTFTGSRANRYTTCRIQERGARSAELGTKTVGFFGSAPRAPTFALLPTVIPGGFEPPLSSVSGRHLEPLGHGTNLNSERGVRNSERRRAVSSVPRSALRLPRSTPAEGVGFEPTRLVRAIALAPRPGQPYPAPVRSGRREAVAGRVGRTPVGRTSKFGTHLPCEQLSRRPSGPAGSRTRAAGMPNRRHPARPQAHFVSCAVEPRGVEPRCRACEAQPPPAGGPSVCVPSFTFQKFQVEDGSFLELLERETWNSRKQ
jgi:hypothetical protein